MSETEQTQKDYSLENEAGRQLENKIEMLFHRRTLFLNDPIKVAGYDLKIQSHLLNLKLLQNIFFNMVKTVLNVKNYEHFKELNEEVGFGVCFMETYHSVITNYVAGKGSFIKYFTASFKKNAYKAAVIYKEKNIKHGLVGIDSKNVLVKSLDAPLKDDEKQTFGDTLSANDKADENNQPENEMIEKLFSKIESIYNETKSGQKNKSIAYTSKVIDYLLTLSREKLEQTVEKYSFLKPQKEMIMYFFQGTENGARHVPQKMYANFCNARVEVICRLSSALVDKLKETFNL